MGRATYYCGSALGPPKKQTFATNDLGKAASLALTQAQKAERPELPAGLSWTGWQQSWRSSATFVRYYFIGPCRVLTADIGLPCNFAPFFAGLLVFFVAMFISFL
jgi:hypothetical protein